MKMYWCQLMSNWLKSYLIEQFVVVDQIALLISLKIVKVSKLSTCKQLLATCSSFKHKQIYDNKGVTFLGVLHPTGQEWKGTLPEGKSTFLVQWKDTFLSLSLLANLDLCLRKPWSGKSHDYCDTKVLKKSPFLNCFLFT